MAGSTSGYLPQRIECRVSKRYLHTHVNNSIIHKSQSVKASQVSINRSMDELSEVYNTMEYYSALKRKEILLHVTTRMNLEDITLSVISQSQKDKYCMIPLT